MAYELTKVGDDESIADQAEYKYAFQNNSPWRRRWRGSRYPVIVLSCLLGLFLFSQIIPKSKTVEDAGSVILSKAHDIVAHKTFVAHATWLHAENLTDSDLNNAVLYPGKSSITSPNNKFRLTFAENGQLVLEADRTSTKAWKPIWWANSAGYATRYKAGKQYLSLDYTGNLQVVRYAAAGPSDFRLTRPWMSDRQRVCGDHIDQKELAESLKEQPKPQSLALDDMGRVIVFDATAQAACIIVDSDAAVVRRRTQPHIAIPIAEAEPLIGNEAKVTHSDNYSLQQLRAMLEADVDRQNMTFDLNSTQLDTIYNTAIIIPSWHGHKDAAVRFLRSMIRNCVDCDRWSINIIAATEDMHFFQKYMYDNGEQSLRWYLPGLRTLEYEHMAFPHYDQNIDVAAKSLGQSKHVLQSFKKHYGCLSTGKKYCSMLDSEGVVLRTTTYADIVREHLDAPFVIHNSDGQNANDGRPCTCRLKEQPFL